MKKVLVRVIFFLSLLSLLLSGCTGTMTATSWPGISSNGSKVFVAFGAQVYAVSPDNGNFFWKYPEKGNAAVSFYATPGVTSDGQVIVCDYKGEVISLNAETGAEKWKYTTSDKIVADPVIDGSTIYVASADYSLYAIHTDGTLAWKFSTGNHLWSKPLLGKDVLYQVSMDHKLYAIDPASGKENWSVELGSASLGSPVMDASGILYVSTLGKEILAIDPASKQITWKYKAADSIWSGVTEKDGNLYFGDLSGNFVALSTSTRQPVWQYKATAAIINVPLLTDTNIFFTSENGLLTTLDYSGKVVSSVQVSEKLYAPPVKVGDLVMVGISDGKDKIFSAVKNGGIAWSFQAPK